MNNNKSFDFDQFAKEVEGSITKSFSGQEVEDWSKRRGDEIVASRRNELQVAERDMARTENGIGFYKNSKQLILELKR